MAPAFGFCEGAILVVASFTVFSGVDMVGFDGRYMDLMIQLWARILFTYGRRESGISLNLLEVLLGSDLMLPGAPLNSI